MADREYTIDLGVEESQTVRLSVAVKQTEPEAKLDFFSCVIQYGGMSPESAAGLKAVCADYQDKIAKQTGVAGNTIGNASYDDLMCVQVLLSELITTLCGMGFIYAESKGIATPKATALKKGKK